MGDFPNMTTISGYKTTYKIIKQGAGSTVTAGNTVTVHATGVIKESGYQFWCTKDNNSPFTYLAGRGKVITGWDQGCLGMKIGESRELTIPADEGYGAGRFPAWKIPKNATLVFTLECLRIQ